MKLYLITANIPTLLKDDPSSDRQVWGGSQADAAAARKSFIEAGAKRKDLKTYEIDVPAGKVDLLQFLNDYQGSALRLATVRKLTAS